jgi:hypothetical protein
MTLIVSEIGWRAGKVLNPILAVIAAVIVDGLAVDALLVLGWRFHLTQPLD